MTDFPKGAVIDDWARCSCIQQKFNLQTIISSGVSGGEAEDNEAKSGILRFVDVRVRRPEQFNGQRSDSSSMVSSVVVKRTLLDDVWLLFCANFCS